MRSFRVVGLFVSLASIAGATTLATVTVTCHPLPGFGLPVDPSRTVTGSRAASYSTQCATFGDTPGSAVAFAAYGSLSTASLTNEFGPAHVAATAQSEFSDTLTIGGGSGMGFVSYTIAFLFAGVADGGSSTSLFSLRQGGTEVLSANAISDLGETCAGPGCSNFPVIFSRDTPKQPFQFGQPFQLSAMLRSETSGDDSGARATAVLTDLRVFDSAGVLVPDAQVEADSGAGYPVPEPASVVFVIGGLLPLYAGRSRRGRQGRCLTGIRTMV